MMNDEYWRTEAVNTFITNREGVIPIIYQKTSLKKNKRLYEAKYYCKAYKVDSMVAYETTKNCLDWQLSIRSCSRISDTATLVHYTIQFEKNIVRKGTNVVPPNFLIVIFLKCKMRKYLNNLKQQVEYETL
jgi:hypothetical protein